MKTAVDADRADPFGDLTEFCPTTARKTKPDPEAIVRICEDNAPFRRLSYVKKTIEEKDNKARRAYRTGRNMQFNMRASSETIGRFHRIAKSKNWTLGETLEYALDCLELKVISK